MKVTIDKHGVEREAYTVEDVNELRGRAEEWRREANFFEIYEGGEEANREEIIRCYGRSEYYDDIATKLEAGTYVVETFDEDEDEDDELSHALQNRLDLVVDKLEKWPLPLHLLVECVNVVEELKDIRDEIPCTCE